MVHAMFLSALVVLLASCNMEFIAAGECNSYDREKLNEGYYKCVYKDPVGLPTVGVGFNLKKFGARGEIESVGADYDKVLDGSQCLDDRQIEDLFKKDMDSAVSCARNAVSNYNDIGDGPQSAVADMVFNMGCATFSTFRGVISYIEKKDFSGAAQDMQTTLWCRQVGNRCARDVDCMKQGLLLEQPQGDGIL